MGILKGKVAVVTGSTSGIGLAYARAFAGAGANIVLNGMGAPADVEKERSAIESDFGVKAVYSPADMAKPRRNRRAHHARGEDLRQRGCPREQCRRPARRPYRGVSGRQVECDHWDQPVLRLPRDPCSRARHEAARLGPYHHHGLGAFAGRIPLQVGLRRGQARHRGTHQDGGAGTSQVEDHLQLHQPRLRLDAISGEANPEYDGGAQHEEGSGDQRRPARGPADEGIRHGRAGGVAGAVPVQPRRRADHRRQPLDRRRLDGRSRAAEMRTGS